MAQERTCFFFFFLLKGSINLGCCDHNVSEKNFSSLPPSIKVWHWQFLMQSLEWKIRFIFILLSSVDHETSALWWSSPIRHPTLAGPWALYTATQSNTNYSLIIIYRTLRINITSWKWKKSDIKKYIFYGSVQMAF